MIYLIRHARPAGAGLLLGSTDVPLSADAEVAVFSAQVDAVYSSPLRRARQTAGRMFPGLAIETWPELAERGLGDWDGLAWAEVQDRWPEDAALSLRDWFAFTPPGGESWASFVNRVERAWLRMLSEAAPFTAVVAHAGVNAVLRQLAGHGPAAGHRQEYGETIALAIPAADSGVR